MTLPSSKITIQVILLKLGGSDVFKPFVNGKDITEVLNVSHKHSDAALRILEGYRVE